MKYIKYPKVNSEKKLNVTSTFLVKSKVSVARLKKVVMAVSISLTLASCELAGSCRIRPICSRLISMVELTDRKDN